MASLLCPIIESMVEVPMLTSDYFRKAGHKIISLQIKIETKSDANSLIATHTLRGNISLLSKDITYNERENVKREMKLTIPQVNPIGGLEELNEQLLKDHPNDNWVVCYMITETEVCGVTHRCRWENKKSATFAGVRSLRLMKIDGKVCETDYTYEEMKAIAGKLADSKCRLFGVTKTYYTPECTPYM